VVGSAMVNTGIYGAAGVVCCRGDWNWCLGGWFWVGLKRVGRVVGIDLRSE